MLYRESHKFFNDKHNRDAFLIALKKVLADGTYTYLYGEGRIARSTGTNPEYFLADALSYGRLGSACTII